MIDKNVFKIEAVVQRLAEFSHPAASEKKEIHNLIETLNETSYLVKDLRGIFVSTFQRIAYEDGFSRC